MTFTDQNNNPLTITQQMLKTQILMAMYFQIQIHLLIAMVTH